MAVVYKGFRVYVVNPDTYADVAYLRNVELTICTTRRDNVQSVTVETLDAAVAAVNQLIDNRNAIAMSTPQLETIAYTQQVYPTTVTLRISREFVGMRLKLVNPSSGNYAISLHTLQTSDIHEYAYLPAATYDLYFSNGTTASRTTIPIGGLNESGFFGYADFDGTVKNRGTMYVWYISVYRDYYNTLKYLLFHNSGVQGVPLNQTFADWFNELTPEAVNYDPYSPGGETGPSGPNTGSWTLINTDVDFPDLPEITASDTGFFSIWVPTLEQIQLLAGFMWNTDPLNIDFWKNMVASPLDLILGLSLFPVELDVDGHESLTLGLVDTRIDTNYRNAQFVDVDCGELDLEEYYGAFLDYAPFTQLDIYLPYIGVRTINTNDVMPKRLHLRYRIDLVSGSCVAMLKANGSVFYHWNGACSVAIPVTTNQMRELVQGVVSAAGAVASGILTGGISGALAATSGVASAAVNSSQHVGRSGTMGSAAGFLGVQTPYLIITRPRQAIPENQNHYTGYPTFITSKLGDLLGYTEVEAVHLHDIPATSDELDEIERLLQEGVIL